MPKPSERRLRLYPALRGIAADEWDDFFYMDGKEWTTKDLEYLLEWVGKEEIITLSYQLGRTPFSIQDTLRRMRSDGWNVPYLRKDKLNERKHRVQSSNPRQADSQNDSCLSGESNQPDTTKPLPTTDPENADHSHGKCEGDRCRDWSQMTFEQLNFLSVLFLEE